MASDESNMIAIYVIVPAVVLILILILVYYCCSRKYRLNWFERTLLEAHDERDSEKEYINPATRSSSMAGQVIDHGSLHRSSIQSAQTQGSERSSSITSCSIPSISHPLGGPQPPPLVSTKYSPLIEPPLIPPVISSRPSTPSSDKSSDKQFWVPPTVLQKKRAQSLVPTLLQPQDSEDSGQYLHPMDRRCSSPSRTPTTSTSLQEMAFTFPEQVAQVPTQAQRSRRRASMQDALDHTKINTSLYDKAMEGRQLSICSIQEDAIGSLHLTLDFNWDNALLTVRLIQAQDLVPHEAGSLADPYCKLCIQPHRKQLVQTKVQKQTLSPEFDEEFLFEVLPDDLPNRTLEILVFDHDQYSKDECLGQCEIPLESVDLSERAVLWRGVMQYDKKKEEVAEYGDLQLQMSYLQSAERLTVTVLKARNLKSLDESKNANPFVKVAITYMNKRMKKKKTSTKKNTLSPSWNEALVFNIGKDMLKHSTIECLVFSDNLLGTSSEPMAKLCIGPESSGDEKMHFKDLLNQRNVSARWHHLVTP